MNLSLAATFHPREFWFIWEWGTH